MGRDNLNVNISVENLLSVEMKKESTCLLRIGGCKIHVVHDFFKAGLKSSKWHIDIFCSNLYIWFKCSSARQEDFKDIVYDIDATVENDSLFYINKMDFLEKVVNRVVTMFMYFVCLSICLSLSIDQWNVLHDYFLRFLHENNHHKFKRINFIVI